MKNIITLKDSKEIKIISNPIRMKVLKNYYTYGQPATVKQMALHMHEVPANIHYHVKKLLEINVLELHHTETVNGILAKFYTPAAKTIKIEDQESSNETGIISERELVLSNLFDDAKSDFVYQMGKHGDDDGVMVSTHLKLNEEEYEAFKDYISTFAENKKTNEDSRAKDYLFFCGIVKGEN